MEKNIHQGHRERLRNKYIRNSSAFEEHELLELLLTYSIPRKNTNELAHTLINRFGSIANVLNADTKKLTAVDGINTNTAVFFKLINELKIIASDLPDFTSGEKMFCVKEVTPLLISVFDNLSYEKFLILFLDGNNRCFYQSLINGVKDSVFVPGKELTDLIEIKKPKSIIIAHNHPSGAEQPSNADDIATAKIEIMLRGYNVLLCDHLIVSKQGVYSYFASGRLQYIKDHTL